MVDWKFIKYDVGARVRCVGCRGQWDLTENKIYTVLEYEEPVTHPTFTFPSYVVVTGDNGKPLHCHASRFVAEGD